MYNSNRAISIPDAKARVLAKADLIKNTSCSNSNPNPAEIPCYYNVPIPVNIMNPGLTNQQVALLSCTNTDAPNGFRTKCLPIDSQMSIRNNGTNGIRFNLASSAFTPDFFSRKILNVNLVKNLNGTVDFIISYYKPDCGPHFPSHPAYPNNHIKLFPINPPLNHVLNY